MLIRRATLADAKALAVLMGELGYPMTPADAENRLQFVAHSPDDELVVADIQGQVVGFIAYRVQEFIERVGRYGYIMAMAVATANKRQGVGSALLDHFEQRMKEQGIRHIRVTSALRRTDEAHKFYQARGYEVTGLRFAKDLDE